MRIIDADALIAWIKGSQQMTSKIKAVICYIKTMPTIDAVSVVRCRECRHKYQEPWNNGVAVEGECEIWHNATLDNDFCSYGERKGEYGERKGE